MLFLRMGILAAFAFSLTTFTAPTHTLCEGFVEENDLSIPVSVFQAGGINEAQFNEVLDTLTTHFGPVIQARGGTLVINRKWTDTTVNASAQRNGNSYVLNMYGGLARHPQATRDFFMLVACHELGHHIGGGPKYSGWTNWASNEGQSDYYATLRCMRTVMPATENEEFVKNNEIDATLASKCQSVYSTSEEQNLCMRIGTAGIQGGYFFQALRNETTVPSLTTPDTRVVTRTSDAHPATQCRMDTYYQGALCLHDSSIALSDTDARVGTCFEGLQASADGIRPRCWFKP